MANKSTKNVSTSSELTALQKVGKELLRSFKKMQNTDYSRIESFDLAVGNLILSLEKDMKDGQKYLSKAVLKEHFLFDIPRQRRNEAKQLAQNWNHEVMVELHKSKRFTSAATLLREFVKQTKTDEDAPKTAEQLAKSVVSLLEKNGVGLDAFAKALVAEFAAQSEETVSETETDKVAA